MYKKRHVEERLLRIAKKFKILYITGARQVGKSTLLAHLFPETPVVVFDPVQDIYGARSDPDQFLDTFPNQTIFDEVQFAPELLPAIKRRVDRRPEKGQYLLTGSQHLGVLRNISESLTGRVGILELENMSLYEAHEDSSNWVSVLLENPVLLLEKFKGILPNTHLTRALWRGAFPALIDQEDNVISEFYRNYVTTYVERDVRIAENISDLNLFGRFLRILAALTAQEINHTELGRELGVSGPTAQRWLSTLHLTYQWREVWPYSGNLIKRVSKKRKGYISDTGMACYLQRIPTAEALLGHPMLGAFFESFCVNLIFKLLSGLSFEVNAYHWRAGSGAKVDLILEKDRTLYPIEFKCKSHIQRHDTRGLRAFREAYPDKNIATGIIVHTGDRPYWIDEHALALPWNITLR